jgi:type VI secretion system protein ImpB
LRDLLGKLDGNDELDALLENILQNTEDLKSLKESTGSNDTSDSADDASAEATA